MHRGDDVVDPEALVEPDHLLGALCGSADQKAVFQAVGKAVVEIIPGRHDLVLPPGAVCLVFLFEVRLGTADRLGAGRRNEDLATHRQFTREGFAGVIERAFVDPDLALDRRQGAVRVDVPAIAEPCRAADRDIGIGADPNGRRRLLQRLYRAVRPVELEMRALHRDEILGPQAPDRIEAFLEAQAQAGARHAKRLEFDIAVADAAAEDQLAARHDIQGGELLGKVERLVQRQQHEPADEAQPRRDRRGIAEERDLLDGFERVGAVMRALDDAVKAERFGAPHELQIVAQMRSDVARRVLAANNEAQLHCAHSGVMPFSASSFFALSFLASLSPMPRCTLGALVNWMFEYSTTSMRLPQGSRKSRNGPSTIFAPAASARALTVERSSTTNPIWRRSTPLCR